MTRQNTKQRKERRWFFSSAIFIALVIVTGVLLRSSIVEDDPFVNMSDIARTWSQLNESSTSDDPVVVAATEAVDAAVREVTTGTRRNPDISANTLRDVAFNIWYLCAAAAIVMAIRRPLLLGIGAIAVGSMAAYTAIRAPADGALDEVVPAVARNAPEPTTNTQVPAGSQPTTVVTQSPTHTPAPTTTAPATETPAPTASAEATETPFPTEAPTDTPTEAPTEAPTDTPTEIPTETPATSGQYKDGEYVGPAVRADRWGDLQVRAIIEGGRLVQIEFVKFPQSTRRSRSISNSALPQLVSEAIENQSAEVDVISRATNTVIAFRESLESALSDARP
jgi:uncharacterized protein with FMN-binding domain